MLDRARFMARVDQSGVCWLWTGARQGGRWNYGQLRVGGRGVPLRSAHRVAWELFVGPIPDGLNVLHRCDNPPCVRPDHLFLGTQGDNMADARAKGRNRVWQDDPSSVRGTRQHLAVLDEDAVRVIRASAASGVDLARQFGVSNATISSVRHKRTWAWLG